MNREIKFRCFHPRVGMRTPDQMWEDSIVFTFDGKVMFDNYVEETHHWKLMQYTGLKDKNGVDIYEGDIVKWDDSSKGKYWRVAEVKIDPSLNFHSFDCPLIDNSSAHGHRFHYGNFIYKDTHNHLEIIGNIHETPELLEVKS